MLKTLFLPCQTLVLPCKTTPFGTQYSLAALTLTSISIIKVPPGVANLSKLGMISGLNKLLIELTTNTMLNPATAVMNTLDNGGTKMFWHGEKLSEHTSNAQLSPITMTTKIMITMVMTPTTTPTTAEISTVPNASGVVNTLPLSRTREVAVHATLSQLLKFLSPMLPLEEMVFTKSLSSRLLTVDMVTTVVAMVDGQHLFWETLIMLIPLSCLLMTTSTWLLKIPARLTQRPPPSGSKLMVLLL